MASRGWEHATLNDVRDRRTVQKPSKYRNVETVVDGIVFDSKREAARYQELMALQHAGEITELRCQVPFPLYCPVQGVNTHDWREVCRYVSDFTYREVNGPFVIEDVKGKRTAMYLLKRKWLELQSGIQIREVR